MACQIMDAVWLMAYMGSVMMLLNFTQNGCSWSSLNWSWTKEFEGSIAAAALMPAYSALRVV